MTDTHESMLGAALRLVAASACAVLPVAVSSGACAALADTTLSLQTRQKCFGPLGNVGMDLRVTNGSDRVWIGPPLGEGFMAAWFDWGVKDARGQKVPLTRLGRALFLPRSERKVRVRSTATVKLGARQTGLVPVALDSLFDLSVPGRYTVSSAFKRAPVAAAGPVGFAVTGTSVIGTEIVACVASSSAPPTAVPCVRLAVEPRPNYVYGGTFPTITDVTLMNTTNADFVLRWYGDCDPERWLRVYILSQDGTQTPMTAYGRKLYTGPSAADSGGAVHIVRLKPGQGYTVRVALSRLFDLTVRDSYRCVVRWAVDGLKDTLRSDEVSFESTGETENNVRGFGTGTGSLRGAFTF